MARSFQIVLSKHQQVQLLEAAAILSFMGKDPTSLPEDRSEWPTFLSGGKLPKAGEPDPEEGADEGVDGHLAPPHVLGYGSVGRGRYSAQQQQQQGARTYALQPISSSVPNPSVSGPRMHDYAMRAGSAGAQAVQVALGLLGVRTPVMAASHTVIGGSSMAASVSASALLSVSRSVSGASSSRRLDSKSTTSTTSSSEDVDIDIDIDSDVHSDEDVDSHRVVFIVFDTDKSRISKLMWRRWRRVMWMWMWRVVSVRPMSTVGAAAAASFGSREC